MQKGNNGYQKYREVMDIGAYEYYTMPRDKDGTHPFNYFLHPEKLSQFSKKIGRKITAREMRFLIALDVTSSDRSVLMSERCVVYSKHFTPVRWVDVEDPRLSQLIQEGLEMETALNKLDGTIQKFGCFYVRHRGASHTFDAYSGALLSSNGSPLAMIHTVEKRCGVPRAQAKLESLQNSAPSPNGSSKKKENPQLIPSGRR